MCQVKRKIVCAEGPKLHLFLCMQLFSWYLVSSLKELDSFIKFMCILFECGILCMCDCECQHNLDMVLRHHPLLPPSLLLSFSPSLLPSLLPSLSQFGWPRTLLVRLVWLSSMYQGSIYLFVFSELELITSVVT